jgi:hypothetical protein
MTGVLSGILFAALALSRSNPHAGFGDGLAGHGPTQLSVENSCFWTS